VERAGEAIGAIAAALEQASHRLGPESATTLASGTAGWAVFLIYAKAVGFGDGLHSSAERCLLHAIDGMAGSPMEPGLFGGFAGTAWTAAHLADRFEIRLTGDAFHEVDVALASYLEQSPWRHEFDLIHGLVGFGIYALERLPQPAALSILARVIDRLEETAERFPPGIAWPTLPEVSPWGPLGEAEVHRHDLGMAHGTPGVLAFLGMTYAAGVAQDRVRALAAQSIDWLLAQKQPDGSRSHFSSFVRDPQSRRTAWCRGDPGVAAAFYLVGRAMGNQEWEREGMALAHSVARRLPEHTGVRDAGLCHGAAGIAHVLHRLSRDSGDEELGRIARQWFERVLDMRRPGEGCAGFTFHMWDEERRSVQRSDPGLLGGSAGIGLALLAAVSDVSPEWDRLLLLSLPRTP
jgi:Lantibiotic modifying enzyme